MHFDILSLFTDFFKGPLDVSLMKRAIDNNLISINLVNIRDFSLDKHNKVDDKPFSGGAGMVLTPQPLADSIKSVKKPSSKVIYLSPQGSPLNSTTCKRLAKEEHLILVSGHYEGIDQRIIDEYVDEEISIGDYVLSSANAAAVVLIDAISRFIPGFILNDEATYEETFEDDMFEGPHYTRPEVFEDMKVPEVLRSGNFKEIEKFKKERALIKMKKVRPDLYFKYLLKEKQNKTKVQS